MNRGHPGQPQQIPGPRRACGNRKPVRATTSRWMKSARLRPMVDTEPWELPKWNDATPLAAGCRMVGATQADHQVGADGVGGVARSASDGVA